MGKVVPELQRYCRFCVVGGSGVIVDTALLCGFLAMGAFGGSLLFCKWAAAELALVNNFVWNERWTFRGRSDQMKVKDILYRCLRFHLICGVGIAMSVMLLEIGVHFILLPVIVSNVIAIGMASLWNYWASARWNWGA